MNRLSLYGGATAAIYIVTLVAIEQMLFVRLLPWLPPDSTSAITIGFDVSLVITALGEVSMLFGSWLLLTALVALAEGRRAPRQLWGWVALAYLPLLLHGLGVVTVLASGRGPDFSDLAAIPDSRLLDAITDVVADRVSALMWLRPYALAASVACVWPGVRRIAGLNVLWTTAVVVAYGSGIFLLTLIRS